MGTTDFEAKSFPKAIAMLLSCITQVCFRHQTLLQGYTFKRRALRRPATGTSTSNSAGLARTARTARTAQPRCSTSSSGYPASWQVVKHLLVKKSKFESCWKNEKISQYHLVCLDMAWYLPSAHSIPTLFHHEGFTESVKKRGERSRSLSIHQLPALGDGAERVLLGTCQSVYGFESSTTLMWIRSPPTNIYKANNMSTQFQE